MNKQKGEGEVEFLILAACIAIIWGICAVINAGYEYCSKEYVEYQRKIDYAHFSTFSQRVASYVPFASNESDKLALKIDELMATNVILKEKKEEARKAYNDFGDSIAKRRIANTAASVSKEEKNYSESLVAQESEYRNKLDQKFESLRRATTEIDYLIEYAKNRYKMLGSDKERSEMIDRIDSLTSKSKNGTR